MTLIKTKSFRRSFTLVLCLSAFHFGFAQDASNTEQIKGSWYIQTFIYGSDTMHGGTIKFNKSNQLVIFDNSRPILDTLSWEMATDSTLIVNVPDRTSQHNEVIIFEIKSVSDIELILSGYGNAGFTYLSLLKE